MNAMTLAGCVAALLMFAARWWRQILLQRRRILVQRW